MHYPPDNARLAAIFQKLKVTVKKAAQEFLRRFHRNTKRCDEEGSW